MRASSSGRYEKRVITINERILNELLSDKKPIELTDKIPLVKAKASSRTVSVSA